MSALPPHREPVREEWIDYNGHLSEAYYILVFGHATDALMSHVGLDTAYRESTGNSLYTVEAHVRYLDEVPGGTTLTVTTRVIGVDAKRARIAHELTVAGRLAATEELMTLHVDGTEGRTTPFPEPVRTALTNLLENPPEYTGRAITAIPRTD
jgi:acyl-CoA thioester hydrolase